MQRWSTPEGLNSLAERAHDGIKTAFPTRCVVDCLGILFIRADETDSQYTSIDYIKNVILTLEVRVS